MARVMSPLDPQVEVRFVADAELDAIIREIVEPGPVGIVQSAELRRAIRGELALGVDEVRIRVAMERVLEPCSAVPARRTGLAFGTLCRGLSAHQRMRISAARRDR